MKKGVFVYICLILGCWLSFAENEKTTKEFNKNALTVISFVQDYVDSEATISLRNNTDTTIYSFSANIIYKDMNGEVLDYKPININLEIPPKLSKTFTIPAFGRSANYVYYKTDFVPSNARKFKIDFELKDYSTKKVKAKPIKKVFNSNKDYEDISLDRVSTKTSTTEDNSMGIVMLIILLVVVLPVLFIFFGLIPYKMAKSRGRNPILWILLCFIITPIWVYLILAIIGDSEEKLRKYYEQMRQNEEKRRQYYEQMRQSQRQQ
ncbi:MAG: hypothetical protein IJ180_03035 [Bacteroidales bacterium]|nr:hypothetical protein [Bacteroidales bacterium]